MIDSAGTFLVAARRTLRGLRLGLAACAGLFLAAQPPGSPVDEYVIKARALVELSPYFKGPETRDTGRPYLIAVVGRSPFGSKLDAYARTRTVQGRRIEVRYVVRASEIQSCDLLFLCRSERRNAGEILDWAKGKGVVTVSDDEDLITRGVMVDLLIEGDRLKIYVNPQAAAVEKFAVSSQLLRMAKLVETRTSTP